MTIYIFEVALLCRQQKDPAMAVALYGKHEGYHVIGRNKRTKINYLKIVLTLEVYDVLLMFITKNKHLLEYLEALAPYSTNPVALLRVSNRLKVILVYAVGTYLFFSISQPYGWKKCVLYFNGGRLINPNPTVDINGDYFNFSKKSLTR